MVNITRVYYYGCYQEAGHYLWEPPMRQCQFFTGIPFSWQTLDGNFCHTSLTHLGSTNEEGELTLTQFKGWTVLAFWDRTIDAHLHSCSAFVVQGTYSTADMLDLAFKHFPEVYERVLPILKIRGIAVKEPTP